MKFAPASHFRADSEHGYADIKVTKMVTDVLAIAEKSEEGVDRYFAHRGIETIVDGDHILGCTPLKRSHDCIGAEKAG